MHRNAIVAAVVTRLSPLVAALGLEGFAAAVPAAGAVLLTWLVGYTYAFPWDYGLLLGAVEGLLIWATVKGLLAPKSFDPSGYERLPWPTADRPQLHRCAPLTPSWGIIRTDGPWFKDEFGRVLLLRGVNLSGSSKVPSKPFSSTFCRQDFFQTKDVTFVGRPFPLEEADEHFARLRAWGLTFIRWIVTWEAVEHAGPGQYDKEYLAYLRSIIRKARPYGIACFIDPHQDVWSRWTGGDGAPAWTLEAVGFDLRYLDWTGSAMTHQMHGDPFPKMAWATNYTKLGAATMFSLFFAGNDFAPKTHIAEVDGVPRQTAKSELGTPVQDYLQEHFIAAMVQVAEALRDEPNVVGFDTLNEPNNGWVGYKHLATEQLPFRFGVRLTPFEAMQLGSGFSVEAEVYSAPFVLAETICLNKNKTPVWREGGECVWKQNGVWGLDAAGRPELRRPDHFRLRPRREGDPPGRGDRVPVDFLRDYMQPFWARFTERIRAVMPNAIIFLEPHIDITNPSFEHQLRLEDGDNCAWAPHYYDATTLVMKSFHRWVTVNAMSQSPVLGHSAVVKTHQDIFRAIQDNAPRRKSADQSPLPTLIGEFGIPFDMARQPAATASERPRLAPAYLTGDFSLQVDAMDTNLQALERSLACWTIWNYTPDNDNVRGDQWNDEDLSIFSKDQQTDPGDLHSGGRALAALVRPYARKVAGTPLRMEFQALTPQRRFTFHFRHDPTVKAPTEFFVPNYQYPQGYQVEVSDGRFDVHRDTQTLTYQHDRDKPEHWVRLWRPA
eukprot:EG_transcript_3027